MVYRLDLSQFINYSLKSKEEYKDYYYCSYHKYQNTDLIITHGKSIAVETIITRKLSPAMINRLSLVRKEVNIMYLYNKNIKLSLGFLKASVNNYALIIMGVH